MIEKKNNVVVVEWVRLPEDLQDHIRDDIYEHRFANDIAFYESWSLPPVERLKRWDEYVDERVAFCKCTRDEWIFDNRWDNMVALIYKVNPEAFGDSYDALVIDVSW